MSQNKKYPFFFHEGHFLPTTPYQVEISFKFHITYFLFVLAIKTTSPYNFLRILESNNANIPYAKLSYNTDFKAQQGEIGKKCTSSPSHVTELSIPYYTERKHLAMQFCLSVQIKFAVIKFHNPQ